MEKRFNFLIIFLAFIFCLNFGASQAFVPTDVDCKNYDADTWRIVGDLDKNQILDVADSRIMLEVWSGFSTFVDGTNDCCIDLNGDGKVNDTDIQMLSLALDNNSSLGACDGGGFGGDGDGDGDGDGSGGSGSRPNVVISSPENKSYDVLRIPLIVNETRNYIVSWSYVLNGKSPVSFSRDTPTTIVASVGQNELVVHAKVQGSITETSKAVYFEVTELAVSCGDGICSSGESCGACSVDCGSCEDIGSETACEGADCIPPASLMQGTFGKVIISVAIIAILISIVVVAYFLFRGVVGVGEVVAESASSIEGAATPAIPVK